MAGDNTISHLAEDDDRALTEILKTLYQEDELLGTGFDANMLAALAMVTRAADEIEDFDAASEWVGMPDYDEGTDRLKLVVSFKNQDDRERFVDETSITIDKRERKTWTTRWPYTEKDDLKSVRFD